MKKFTKSSLKSFIKTNKDNLYIKIQSSFNWMIDCVENKENPELIKIDPETIDFSKQNSFWINWLWLVPWSRNSFWINWKEIEIYNCCGSCILTTLT